MHRRRELDFLRGIAIILVLFRHKYLLAFTERMGWIGVDLFFVLSGFLVSGLLFREYLKSGNIRPRRFLVRRGFKIYPLYFLTYPLYLFPFHHLWTPGILADLTFTQNYVTGLGYAYYASWSLAVEEHFYLGLCGILWMGIRYNRITLRKRDTEQKGMGRFEVVMISAMALCTALRLWSNYYFPGLAVRNTTMTHLRIDSLLAGVLIAYLYYFRLPYLEHTFRMNKYLSGVLCVAGLIWTPFVDPGPSFFVKTFGFTLLYISFGILLCFFLLTPGINRKLNRVCSAFVVNTVSRIGYCSYAIYIIHTLVNAAEEKFTAHVGLYHNHYIRFVTATGLSVVTGMVLTFIIEKYFLGLRDTYFPPAAPPYQRMVQDGST